MKKFIPLAALFISLVFSSVCFAEWTLHGKNKIGGRFYIDLDLIQIKNKQSVFYWQLIDYAKPTKFGDLSDKAFTEADCGNPRDGFLRDRKRRVLTVSFYKQPMAQGDPLLTVSKTQEWAYPMPGSGMEAILKTVCALAEKK